MRFSLGNIAVTHCNRWEVPSHPSSSTRQLNLVAAVTDWALANTMASTKQGAEESSTQVAASGTSSYIEEAQAAPRRALSCPGTLEEALHCVGNAKRIVCIVGAGISTNSGIPDFRSPDSGLYAQIAAGAFGKVPVSEPQELYVLLLHAENSRARSRLLRSFDINIFRDEPELFYSVAGSFLQQFADAAPSPTHAFLAGLAAAGVLQRVYTQNIDGLEAKSGVPAEKVVQCHGSLDSAMCASCNAKATISVVQEAAALGKVARCTRCRNGAIKPSVVFFHEALPKRFHSCLKVDIKQADLVLVMGSSMRVAPVSKMLSLFSTAAPAVLVNRDRVTGQADQSQFCRDEFDVELLGDADLMYVIDTAGLKPNVATLRLTDCVLYRSSLLLEQIASQNIQNKPKLALEFDVQGRLVRVRDTQPSQQQEQEKTRGTKRSREKPAPAAAASAAPSISDSTPVKAADVLLACAAVLKRSRQRKPSRRKLESYMP